MVYYFVSFVVFAKTYYKYLMLLSQVCGSSGNASTNSSCPEDPCGGVGCKDNDTLVCGGPHCNGTVGESIRVLEKVRDVSKNLTAVIEDLMSMNKTVCVHMVESVFMNPY